MSPVTSPGRASVTTHASIEPSQQQWALPVVATQVPVVESLSVATATSGVDVEMRDKSQMRSSQRASGSEDHHHARRSRSLENLLRVGGDRSALTSRLLFDAAQPAINVADLYGQPKALGLVQLNQSSSSISSSGSVEIAVS